MVDKLKFFCEEKQKYNILMYNIELNDRYKYS